MTKQNKSKGRDSAAIEARRIADKIEQELEVRRTKETFKVIRTANRDDPGMELT